MPRPPKFVVVPPGQIGQRIRAIRGRRGLSQGELARALATKQSNISDIERGVRGLSVQQLVRLARVLRTTPDEILGEAKARQAPSNGHIGDRRFLRRLQKIDTLTRRQKDALLMTIDTFLRGASPGESR